APYIKWLGSAFRQLASAPALQPQLEAMLQAATWEDREGAYLGGVSALATRSNELGLVPAIDPTPRRFHDRPLFLLGADRFADAHLEASGLGIRGFRGAVDQWVDNTDLLSSPGWRA